jgi:hypothetical protein
VQRAGQRQVVDEAALASEEARILSAAYPLSHHVGQGADKLCTPARPAAVS